MGGGSSSQTSHWSGIQEHMMKYILSGTDEESLAFNELDDAQEKAATKDIGFTPEHCLMAKLKDGLDNNPYKDNDAYNPDTDLGEAESSMDDLQTLISTISPRGDVTSYGTQAAVSALPDNITSVITDALKQIADSALADIETEYEDGLTKPFMSGLSRFAGGMSEINAVNSSSFVIGMGMMESEHQSSIRKFKADLRHRFLTQMLEIYTSIYGLLVNGMISMRGMEINADIASFHSEFDFRKLKIASKDAQLNLNMKIDDAEKQWGLGLMAKASSILGAGAGGGATMDQGRPSTVSAVAGVLGTIGGAVAAGPIGVAVGKKILGEATKE